LRQHRPRIELFEAKRIQGRWHSKFSVYIFGSVTPRWPWYLPPRSL
jgi:hypothetical protein